MEEVEVSASLSIELGVTCPYCDAYFDLLSLKAINDDGYLINQACPSDGCWSDSHDKFRECINCPDCRNEVKVVGITY